MSDMSDTDAAGARACPKCGATPQAQAERFACVGWLATVACPRGCQAVTTADGTREDATARAVEIWNGGAR